MSKQQFSLLKQFLLQLKSKITNDTDLQALVYALGLINKQIFAGGNESKHLVIIGPTQSGKSTLVNLLLGEKQAKPSVQAAFTRKAHGFAQGEIATLVANMKNLFSYDDTLADENNIQFTIEPTHSTNFTNWIVWDTADFDSVTASEYKESTLMLYALADVVVLVVSKEKYADLAVWQTLRLGKNINKPLLVFINKVDAVNVSEIVQIVKDKFSKAQIKAQEIYALPYVIEEVESDLQNHPTILSARKFINNNSQNNKITPNEIKDFLDLHWSNWTLAIEQEITANHNWQKMLDKEIQVMAEAYTQNYLQNSIYGETMQQIMIRLLELLEIPKIANTLGRARSIITWPARTLFEKFKSKTETKDSLPSAEEQVLRELYENTGASLLREIGDRVLRDDKAKVWWQELWQVFKKQDKSLSDDFTLQIKKHQAEFAPQIARAAEEVYQGIQSEPITLNSLRAARVSVDAVAIIFALKTGGIGAHDLFLTPAMLAFSSFITESAVGHYLKKAESELKAKQIESVEKIIFKLYKNKLSRLPGAISKDKIYAISENDFDHINKLRQKL